MSRTHIQQSQVSGSLSFDDSLEAGSGLAGKTTIAGDLNALRSQIKRIIGKSNWYDALDGVQDLADIYAAVRVNGANAQVQGNLIVSGNVTLGDASSDSITFTAKAATALDMDTHKITSLAQASASGDALAWGQNASIADLTVTGALVASGNVTLGDANTDSITFTAKAATALDMDTHKVTNLAQASATGDALGWGQNASVSDLIVTAGDFTVDASGNIVAAGTAKVNNASDPVGHLYLVGAANQISASTGLAYDGSLFQVTGSMDVSNGLTVSDGGLSVSGDRLEVTGTFAVAGTSDFNGSVYVAAGNLLGVSGSLTVAGAADFNGGISANSFSIDGDVAKRLYIVDTDGSIKDEEKLWFDGSKLYVTGSAELSSNLEVKGGTVTMSNSVSMASSAANKLVVTASDVVELTGDLKIGGDTIKSSTADAMQLSGADVEVKGDLQVSGNDIKSSTGAVVVSLSGDDAFFQSDVTVAGNLSVQGAMTYISTDNLKVKDSIIHLSTGSNSAVSRGIVLHGGAGSGGDLAVGAKNTGYDFILAKEVSDADVDAGNSEIFSGAKLAAAWMSSVKLGDAEGALSGSLSVSSGGIQLVSEAGKSMLVQAATDLSLAANGNTVGLMSAADYTLFDTNFTATTIVGALNELRAGGGGVKGVLSSANVAGGILTFSSIGTLNTADQKYVDVYLNGVLLSYGTDVTAVSTTTATLDAGIASALIADDVFTVVLRNAA